MYVHQPSNCRPATVVHLLVLVITHTRASARAYAFTQRESKRERENERERERERERESSVVRAFADGAMGRRIDPSLGTH